MSQEPKKLALLRIKQILEEYTDEDHQLSQEEIATILSNEYGIEIERKAIGRNVSLLKEAGMDIESGRNGAYLADRDFDDSEIRLLIDSVISSRHITAKYSKDLINKLCALSNKYFKSHVNHIYSVDEWSKTDNPSLFYNIQVIDIAVEEEKRVEYTYNKYGADGKLHRSSTQVVSPYQLVLHNQHYYLMAYSEYWGNMIFHRLDHITNIKIKDEKATRLRSLPGYENGIDYKMLATSMPYMYSDEPEYITFKASTEIIDHIVDWFGKGARITKNTDDDTSIIVSVKASPMAMENWAAQYINYVEILTPVSLREKIAQNLKNALKKYK